MTCLSPALSHWLLAVVVLTMGLTERAFGADRSPGLRMLDRTTIVTAERIRKELGIKAEQVKEIDAVLKKQKETWSGLFAVYRKTQRGGTPEARAAKRAEVLTAREELAEKTETAIAKVLDEKQNGRVEEILLQYRGLYGLLTDRVIQALKLSKAQVGDLRDTIATRERKEAAADRPPPTDRLTSGTGGTRPEPSTRRELLAMIREDARKRAAQILSDKQREELEKLKGVHFPMRPRVLFGRQFLGIHEGETMRGRRRSSSGATKKAVGKPAPAKPASDA